MKKKGHSANGKRTTPFAGAWKALLAVAVFGLALGVVGCGKKSRSSGNSSAWESSSSSSTRESSSSESQAEPKVCTLPGGVKLEMVHVEPGSFVMGDKDGEKRLERIAEGFWLGKFEMTQAQWEAVMGENPSRFKGADNPVENVSWDDCQEFLKKLNALPAVRESGLVFRLPTEKEWEYACRAGSTGDYCKLADGTEITERTLGEVAWYDGNSGGKTHLVGQKKPNAFGLYDMHGNVWEWCEDLCLAGYSNRVHRGGGWYYGSGCCAAGARGSSYPDPRNNCPGFRLAASQDVKSRSSGSSSERESPSSESRVETKVCALPGGVKLEMVHVEPVSFVMGDKDEEKRRERIAEGFWLGKFEMTQAQWKAVMGENPSRFKGADKPVENVSWDDCQKFLKKLNELPSVKESGLVFRLPTEEEWEYACRAGSGGGYCKLAGGTEITESTLGEVAWYDGNSGKKTYLVGQKKPNAFGLYDMHGNVCEWCEDRAGDSRRVRRGGSWSNSSRRCAAGFRFSDFPGYRCNYLGFRLAASQDAKSKSSSSSSASKPSSSKSQVETKACTLPGGVKLEMVHVEPGSFVTGDDKKKRLERIAEGFWLGKFEVTQAQWEAVMGENPSRFKGADNPVERVSWEDCQGFLKKLNALPAVGKSGLVFRLPTEKEWEYACRAGSTGDYCKLADGTEITESTLGKVAWYCDNSGETTHLVGQKTSNAFGLYDMHGNVCEWCEDRAGNSRRVRRGGSWFNYSRFCIAGLRYSYRPAIRRDFLGFRLAASQDVNRQSGQGRAARSASGPY